LIFRLLNLRSHTYYLLLQFLQIGYCTLMLLELGLRYEHWHFKLRDEIEVIENYLALHQEGENLGDTTNDSDDDEDEDETRDTQDTQDHTAKFFMDQFTKDQL
jgi:hypothetical protein